MREAHETLKFTSNFQRKVQKPLDLNSCSAEKLLAHQVPFNFLKQSTINAKRTNIVDSEAPEGQNVTYTFGCDKIGLGLVNQVGPGEKLDF